MKPDDGAVQRARARRDWPVRMFHLGDEPGPDLSLTTPEERVAAVWRLTVEAWSLAGRPLPGYSRDEMPIRVRSLDGAVDP